MVRIISLPCGSFGRFREICFFCPGARFILPRVFFLMVRPFSVRVQEVVNWLRLVNRYLLCMEMV